MTMLVELDPETEARVAAQAGRRGMAPERYVGEFLRENVPNYATGTGTGILTPGDVEELSRRQPLWLLCLQPAPSLLLDGRKSFSRIPLIPLSKLTSNGNEEACALAPHPPEAQRV